jgi:hypothetical protein
MNYEMSGIVPYPDGTPRAVRVYFVELDDDDRERVISGVIDGLTITANPTFEDIHTMDSFSPVMRYVSEYEVTMEARFKPGTDGTYFRIENFAEESAGSEEEES